jgi:hypothetical protein
MRELKDKVSKPFVILQFDKEIKAQIKVIKNQVLDQYELYLKQIPEQESLHDSLNGTIIQ